MSTIAGNLVVGIFENHESADQALVALRAALFVDTEMGVIAPHAAAGTHASLEASSVDAEKKMVEEVSAGALLGAGVGGLGALALATLMIPPFGPVIFGGFLTLLAVGGTGGALAGGLVGALVGLGLPERHAHEIEQALLAGSTIVKVHTDTRQVEAAEILDRCGAQRVSPPSPEAMASTEHNTRHAHLDMRPESLMYRDDDIAPAGGFTATGGFGELAKSHDSHRHFHIPGARTDKSE
jgi:hypothetical protein